MFTINSSEVFFAVVFVFVFVAIFWSHINAVALCHPKIRVIRDGEYYIIKVKIDGEWYSIGICHMWQSGWGNEVREYVSEKSYYSRSIFDPEGKSIRYKFLPLEFESKNEAKRCVKFLVGNERRWNY